MKTKDFSKIDHESLDEFGLWMINVTYDNTKEGKGTSAIMTYLFRGAQTYTSNVRTNADGTIYRFKNNPKGASLQAIALPQQNTVIVPEDSIVIMFGGIEISLDEVDDSNLAEQNVFSRSFAQSKKAYQFAKTRYQWMKAGSFNAHGHLDYEIESATLGDKVLKFVKPIFVSTNVIGTSSSNSIDGSVRKQIMDFVETHFPKGFSGKARLQLKGQDELIDFPLKLNTLKTLQESGVSVQRLPRPQVEKLAERMKGVTL